MMVTQQQKKEWGSYEDRKDSYDDKKDIESFISMVESNSTIQRALNNRLPKSLISYEWKQHPHGQYGADFGLMDIDTKDIAMSFDVERWSAWGEEWPSYYQWIHFLGRKDHFLDSSKPFMMVYLNYPKTQCCMLDKETLAAYPTKDKYFAYKKCWDRVKEIPIREGMFFR